MTRFRYPVGWNTQRQPGERPNIAGTWLDEPYQLTLDI